MIELHNDWNFIMIGTSLIIVAMAGHHPISSNRNIQPDLQSPPPPLTSFASHLLQLTGWYDDHEQILPMKLTVTKMATLGVWSGCYCACAEARFVCIM